MDEMNEAIERVARAIKEEMRRQEVLFEVSEVDGEDLGRLMMNTGEAADLTAVCRAALQSLRDPTAAMCVAGLRAADGGEASEATIWNAMVDDALKGTGEPEDPPVISD